MLNPADYALSEYEVQWVNTRFSDSKADIILRHCEKIKVKPSEYYWWAERFALWNVPVCNELKGV